MLTNAAFLKGLAIHATDGELGTVEDFYFDDESWGVRYLIVKTGGWLLGKEILLSPISIIRADWDKRRLDVALTKQQVENSPNIDTHLSVSRLHEAEYSRYYAYSNYWGGPYLWGPESYPSGLAVRPGLLNQIEDEKESLDSHLRSAKDVKGYHVEAKDGEIGHVDGYVVDDENWSIRYVEVATRNWLPGKRVLVSPAWIDRVSWLESKIYAELYRQAIEDAPEYFMSEPVTREFENRLYFHYGHPPYWVTEAAHKSPALV